MVKKYTNEEAQEMRVQSLHQQTPPEEEMETHLSILAWKIPWTDEPGRLLSMGSQKLDTTERLTHILFDAEVI